MPVAMSSEIARFHFEAATHFLERTADVDETLRASYVVAAIKAAISAANAEVCIITGTDPLQQNRTLQDVEAFMSLLDETPNARAEQRLLGFTRRLAGEANIALSSDTFKEAAIELLNADFAKWCLREVESYVVGRQYTYNV